MRMRGIVAAAVAAAALGTIPVDAHAQNAEAAEREVRRCADGPLQAATPVARAAACAEEFVVRNGYTDLPADADSTHWAPEAVEQGPRAQWPQTRRGSVDRKPVAVCHPRRIGGGFIVVFTTPARTYLRAVTMKSDFSRMRMEHQALNPMWFTAPTSGCTSLPRGEPGATDTVVVVGGSPRPE